MVKLSRREAGMSQEEFAHTFGVSFAMINRWENGSTKPSKLACAVFLSYCEKIGIVESAVS
jgi:DNA-binding transcriptional regulator YiaG